MPASSTPVRFAGCLVLRSQFRTWAKWVLGMGVNVSSRVGFYQVLRLFEGNCVSYLSTHIPYYFAFRPLATWPSFLECCEWYI